MNAPAFTGDLIDRIVDISTTDPLHAVRHQRQKVVLATQGSYDALFDAQLPGQPLSHRLLLAYYAALLTPSAALAAHYRARLQDVDIPSEALIAVETDKPESVEDPALRAVLLFTRTLILDPVKGDRAALETLPAAGISTPDVVALSQLIAFLSYQIRLVAGLQAMKALGLSEHAA